MMPDDLEDRRLQQRHETKLMEMLVYAIIMVAVMIGGTVVLVGALLLRRVQ